MDKKLLLVFLMICLALLFMNIYNAFFVVAEYFEPNVASLFISVSILFIGLISINNKFWIIAYAAIMVRALSVFIVNKIGVKEVLSSTDENWILLFNVLSLVCAFIATSSIFLLYRAKDFSLRESFRFKHK